MSLSAVLLALSVAGAAPASGPLAWRWTVGQPVSWHAETVTLTPRGTWFLASENLEARAIQTNLVVDMTCTATEALSSGWTVRCVLDEVQVSGTAVPGEEPKLDAIFDEYERLFRGSAVDFTFTAAGRIRSLDLDAFEKTTSRTRDLEEVMRLTISRAFALLELELPKRGDDRGKAWSQGGSPLLMALRSSQGTAGGISLKHRVVAREAQITVFETEGRATVAPGATMEADGTLLTSLVLGGQGRFDTELGLLEYREYIAQAQLTAGSAQAMPGTQFKEIGTLERVQPPLPEVSRRALPEPAPPAQPEVPPAGDPPADPPAPDPSSFQ